MQRRCGLKNEYARAGALAYLAAWDVHRAKLFGRCERKNGIAAFKRLVAQVMNQEPYRSGGCPTASHVAKCRSGSHTNSRQLAQLDRGLLLHRSAQAPHADRV
jgi:hypothetical protein